MPYELFLQETLPFFQAGSVKEIFLPDTTSFQTQKVFNDESTNFQKKNLAKIDYDLENNSDSKSNLNIIDEDEIEYDYSSQIPY